MKTLRNYLNKTNLIEGLRSDRTRMKKGANESLDELAVKYDMLENYYKKMMKKVRAFGLILGSRDECC